MDQHAAITVIGLTKDRRFGGPISGCTTAVLTRRDTAEELCRILGTGHSVGILLIEQ